MEQAVKMEAGFLSKNVFGTPTSARERALKCWFHREKTAQTAPFLFKVLPGQYFDEETNLHYNHFRYYDPQLGRYITSDPLGFASGFNTYSYVGQAVTLNSDPTGLVSWNNKPPIWRTANTQNVTLRPFTGSGLGATDSRTLGYTIGRWTVSCECVCNGSGYVLQTCGVDFQLIAVTNPPSTRCTRGDEQDHINDFMLWANTVGNQVAQAAEEGQRGIEYSDQKTCEAKAEGEISAALTASYRTANNNSANRHDVRKRANRPAPHERCRR